MSKGFKFLEHTADVYIVAYGRNLAEAFEQAASAMLEVTTDSEKVEPKVEDYVEVTAWDECALLYNWLEAILVKSEVNQMLYSKFEVLSIEKTHDGLRLRARIWGEPFNPMKHPQKVGIKAVTYHRMEIDIKPDKATVKFILDI
ncbi:MAG: archease [Candidatus Bathyarchaeota archaeon]|nr:archease [Candidatus Bathyarchaeota archaeon]